MPQNMEQEYTFNTTTNKLQDVINALGGSIELTYNDKGNLVITNDTIN